MSDETCIPSLISAIILFVVYILLLVVFHAPKLTCPKGYTEVIRTSTMNLCQKETKHG